MPNHVGAADITLYAVALAFLAMGCTALLRPASIGRYFELAIITVDSRNEVRAVYGGFGVAMAGALVIATRVDSLRAGVVACVALALAGMAAGRLFSALFERPGRWPWVFCAIELAGALSLAFTHY